MSGIKPDEDGMLVVSVGCDTNQPLSIPENFCKGMKDVLSLRVEEGIQEIGPSAFRHCRRLGSILLPEGLQEIGSFCFEQCVALKEVVLPESLTSLGHSSFRNCRSLSRVNLPESIRFVPMGVFSGCVGITSVVIPEGVRSIGTWAFSCTSISSIDIPASVSVLGQGAFFACSQLESLVIPSNVKSLGEKCFGSCARLRSVTIEEGLEEIGPYAFSDCSSLSFLALPKTVTSFSRWFGYRPYQTRVFAPGVSLSEVDSILYKFSLALGFMEQDFRVGVNDPDLWAEYRPFIQNHLLDLCRTSRFRGSVIRWLIANDFVSDEIYRALLDEATEKGFIAGTAELLEHSSRFSQASSVSMGLLLDDENQDDYLLVSAGLEL